MCSASRFVASGLGVRLNRLAVLTVLSARRCRIVVLVDSARGVVALTRDRSRLLWSPSLTRAAVGRDLLTETEFFACTNTALRLAGPASSGPRRRGDSASGSSVQPRGDLGF